LLGCVFLLRRDSLSAVHGRSFLVTEKCVMTWQFECSGCDSPVLIPPESPLGKSVYLPSQSTDMWPIDFLCWQCGRVVPLDRKVRPALYTPDPSGEQASLWVIEGACGHENCGRHFAVYTKQRTIASEDFVIRRLLEARTPYQCKAGHPCEMKVEAMTAHPL
jgi:hypothetical protein